MVTGGYSVAGGPVTEGYADTVAFKECKDNFLKASKAVVDAWRYEQHRCGYVSREVGCVYLCVCVHLCICICVCVHGDLKHRCECISREVCGLYICVCVYICLYMYVYGCLEM